MAERKIQFIEGLFYHLYNRGIDKRLIFLDDADCSRFLILLYLCNSKKSYWVSSFHGYSFSDFFKLDTEPLVYIGAYWRNGDSHHYLAKGVR